MIRYGKDTLEALGKPHPPLLSKFCDISGETSVPSESCPHDHPSKGTSVPADVCPLPAQGRLPAQAPGLVKGPPAYKPWKSVQTSQDHREICVDQQDDSNPNADELIQSSITLPDSVCRYTDDVMLAVGTQSGLCFGWMEMSQKWLVSLPESINGKKYIGTVFTYTSVENEADGSIDFTLRWSQVDLLGKYLAEFQADCDEKGIKIKNRATPCPSTDVITPRTREDDEMNAAKVARIQAAEDKKPGVFAAKALHYVNAIAFLCSCTRFDLNFAVRQLQTFSANWTPQADRLLIWLFGYLNATSERILYGWINSRDIMTGEIYLFVESDASHTSQKDTRKSVVSFNVYIKGPRTSVLVHSHTMGLDRVTLSTAESELAGAQKATQVGLICQMLINVLLGVQDAEDTLTRHDSGIDMQLALDALSTIKIIKRAGSTKVAHVRRTVGVSIFWLHEVYVLNRNCWLSHVAGSELAADQGTKGLSYDVFTKHRKSMGVIDSHDDGDAARDAIIAKDISLQKGTKA